MTVEQAARILEARKTRKLYSYRPYEKQREFHEAGAKYRERALIAANKVGKTYAMGYEKAMHLLGWYPEWWKGRRIEKEIVMWAAGVTRETTTKTVQEVMMGPPHDMGTGAIPKENILETYAAPGAGGGALEGVLVKSKFGISRLHFKAFDQGQRAWWGPNIDEGWCDEEPPLEIWTELVTRLWERRGCADLTFTPLQRMTDVVEMFFPQPTAPHRYCLRMTMWDADHFAKDPEYTQSIIDGIPEHERQARVEGLPTFVTGRVFRTDLSEIMCEPFEIPKHWSWIGGIDFGMDHPAALVWLAHDRDRDVLYIPHCWRESGKTIGDVASVMRSYQPWMTWMWPKDGMHREARSGLPTAELYRHEGIKMHRQWALHPDGNDSIDGGIEFLRKYMESGRFKVFNIHREWFEEYTAYQRDKNGKVIPQKDDLMSATRYAGMGIECGLQSPPSFSEAIVSDLDYDPLDPQRDLGPQGPIVWN